MIEETLKQVRDLLLEAKKAHGEYETNELGGKYDEAWAEWYARWLLKNGINKLLAQSYGVDSLSRSLTAMAEAQKESGVEAEKWADYYAGKFIYEAR